MSLFTFSLESPGWWGEYCASHNYLFHSAEWQSLLEKAFACRTIYAWNQAADCCYAITGFQAGPFRIGYLGFPVGGSVVKGGLDLAALSSWKVSRIPLTPHCLRIPASPFDNAPELPLQFLENPETAIVNLQDWSMDSVSKKLRRDIRKAKKSALTLTDGTLPSNGRQMYRIYRDTVKRHRGSLRYNEDYFTGLISLSRSNAGLRCILAMLEEEVAGFVVVCRHADTAYYLHGGTNISHKRQNPSDFLLYEAIKWAREEGSQCFNLMTSSEKQPSLVRYKEKWGGITRPHKTYIYAMKIASCMAFRLAEKISRLGR